MKIDFNKDGITTPVYKVVGTEVKTVNRLEVELSEDSYVANLPEGITLEQVKAIDKHNSEYITTLATQGAEAATVLFNKDNTLGEVIYKAPFNSDKITSRTSSVNVGVIREKTSSAPGSTEKMVKPGINIKVDHKSESIPASVAEKLRAQMMDSLLTYK